MNTLIKLMPLLVFVAVTTVARLMASRRRTMPGALSIGLAALFTLTGVSHFVGMREELERMVPPALGNPGFWVAFTGIAELAGAIGLLIPKLRMVAAIGLSLLLVAVFPANVYDIVREGRGLAPLAQRAAEQLVYLAAVLWAGFGTRREGAARSF